MTINFLTSGFPNGFTSAFIDEVKKYLTNRSTFVFLASDFDHQAHDITDHYCKLFLDMFRSFDIHFDNVYIIDYRVTMERAAILTEIADFVWISGGDTLKQISYIKEYQLIDVLRNRSGITMGMSAGSINMAKRVVLARDVEDNVPELSIYEGIGLVDINIEPHIDLDRTEHIEDIKVASKYNKIYGLYDESFITVVNDKVEIFGDYILFN